MITNCRPTLSPRSLYELPSAPTQLLRRGFFGGFFGGCALLDCGLAHTDRGDGEHPGSRATSGAAAAPLFANSKAKGQLPESTKAQLNELYRPYDDLLTGLLRQHGIPWEGWPST